MPDMRDDKNLAVGGSPKRTTPLSQPSLTGRELQNIADVLESRRLSGDGAFTGRCHDWLVRQTGAKKALLTHSCTAALEMAALLTDIEPGDEVIMPSYTFVSTANAFVLRGGVPVFVDVRGDTLNLDETLIEAAITPKTRGIVPVHYGGVACEMDAITALAQDNRLFIVEDAAQGLLATYKGHPLGSLGDLATLSFHETKNVVSGEGGALLINDEQFSERAEVVREKGTDRSRFMRGETDKYTWRDVGSSYLPSDIVAAFLAAQLEDAETITSARLHSWERYHTALADLEAQEKLRRPVVPQDCRHNGHIYYILLPDQKSRDNAMDQLANQGIRSAFHYVPLHNTPAGRRYSRANGDLNVTDDIANRLLRLPMYADLDEDRQDQIVALLEDILSDH